MAKPITSTLSDFHQVIIMINDARNRAYSKANAELVMLYFNIGKIVSEKVLAGNWGDGTVNDLADYIAEKQPLLKGFNHRGLYRMKQFYEVYSDEQIVSTLLTKLQADHNLKVSPVVTQLESSIFTFCKRILLKINWTHHLLILSKTKGIEENQHSLPIMKPS